MVRRSKSLNVSKLLSMDIGMHTYIQLENMHIGRGRSLHKSKREHDPTSVMADQCAEEVDVIVIGAGINIHSQEHCHTNNSMS